MPGYAALILRRTFKQLALPGAIMARSKEWLAPARNRGEVHWNDDDKTWTFPSGATLTFGYLEAADDIYRYQGPEFQFVGFDELTQFQLEQYTYMFSRTRRRVDLPVPVRVRSASNPGGVGHAWVKDRFPIQLGETPANKGGRIFVPAKVADNPGLDPAEYELSLGELSETLRKQLMDGDWGVFEGAAFTLTDDHLIDDFVLTNAHDQFEACDYGLNGAPWALWTVDYEGNLIAHDMLYERDLLPSQLALLVIARRKATWGNVGQTVYADPSIWHRTGTLNRWGQPAVLADEFTDNGVPVTQANNDPRAGLIRCRELLRLDPARRFPPWHPRAGEPGAPRVFFVRGRCEPLINEVRAAPVLPTDKKDGGEKIDPDWESRHGHAVAMFRYAAMTRPTPSVEPDPWDGVPAPLREQYLRDPDELRAEAIREYRERTQRERRDNPGRRTERV